MILRTNNPLLSALLLTFCVGCATTPEPPPDVPQEVEQEVKPPAIPPATLYTLLDLADQAIAEDHLTYPEEGSAFQLYNHILQLDPDQEDAQRGLERIVERYIALAMQALQRGQYAGARSMLARARIILPNHPSIEPSERQIRLLSKAQRSVLQLSQQALREESPDLVASIVQFAQPQAESQDCRYTINAKNDAQGRWIYQTLNSASGDNRVRAQINLRLPASVERMCFSDS